jgi:hypothetical protein
MSSIPQCRIERAGSESEPFFIIHQSIDGERQTLEKQFSSHQQALDYILAQGWQVEREGPEDSMIIASRFLKP